MSQHPFRLVLPLAAALALSGGLAGCAKDAPSSSSGPAVTGSSAPGSTASPGATDSPSSTQAPDGDASSSNAGSPEASASPSNQSTASADLGRPVGQKSLRMGPDAYTLKIYPPQRQDQTVTLTFDLSIDAATEGNVDSKVLSSADSPLSRAGGVPNGLALIDTAGAKMYLPATTGDTMDTALCTPTIPTGVKTGEVYTFSCVFAGVPQTLSTVTVRSESFGNFSHVAIR